MYRPMLVSTGSRLLRPGLTRQEEEEEEERERERESFIRNNLHNGVVSGAARGQALLGPMWAGLTRTLKETPRVIPGA